VADVRHRRIAVITEVEGCEMGKAHAVVAVAFLLCGPLMAQDLGTSYKWDMPADPVQSFDSAAIAHGSIDVTFEKGCCVPIVAADVGVTGFTVIAPGHITMQVGNGDPIIDADIHGLMVRFNPADLEHVFAAENAQTQEDPGFATMAKNVTMGVFRHCWHRSWDALIPPPGSVSIDCFSKADGDVLCWDNGTEYGAYNFTTRTELAKGQL